MLDRTKIVQLFTISACDIKPLLAICHNNITMTDSDGLTLAHWCVKFNRIDYLSNPILHSCLGIQNKDGDTPLHLAIQQGDNRFVLSLLRLDCNWKHIISLQNNQEDTPLHLALYQEPFDINIIKTLLSHHACYTTENNNKKSSLSLIMEHQDKCLHSVFAGSLQDLLISTLLDRNDFDNLNLLILQYQVNIIQIMLCYIRYCKYFLDFPKPKDLTAWLFTKLVTYLQHNNLIPNDYQPSTYDDYFSIMLLSLSTDNKIMFVVYADLLLSLGRLAYRMSPLTVIINTYKLYANNSCRDANSYEALVFIEKLVKLAKQLRESTSSSANNQCLSFLASQLLNIPTIGSSLHYPALENIAADLENNQRKSTHDFLLLYEIYQRTENYDKALDMLIHLKKCAPTTHTVICDLAIAEMTLTGQTTQVPHDIAEEEYKKKLIMQAIIAYEYIHPYVTTIDTHGNADHSLTADNIITADHLLARIHCIFSESISPAIDSEKKRIVPKWKTASLTAFCEYYKNNESVKATIIQQQLDIVAKEEKPHIIEKDYTDAQLITIYGLHCVTNENIEIPISSQNPLPLNEFNANNC
jgi:tetratricopeptide (TPR) repeat protein